MADSISPVNLPPIAPAGDAPRQDSRGGSAGRNKKNKSPGGPKDENPEENNDTADPQSKAREKKSPSSDIDFERTDHKFDGFA
jgi:hypothetical protein